MHYCKLLPGQLTNQTAPQRRISRQPGAWKEGLREATLWERHSDIDLRSDARTRMEGFLTAAAVPFHPPSYAREGEDWPGGGEGAQSILVRLGDRLAEELQDPASAVSAFILGPRVGRLAWLTHNFRLLGSS